jgi:beta-galactosidase
MGFDYSKVKDPGFYRENRLDPYSDHSYYRNEAEAKKDCSSFFRSLNGLWKFSYAKNYEAAARGFELPEYDSKSWDEITVPGHIQMQGYDAPQYVNSQYPWDGHEDIEPGEIPVIYNPVGSYITYFNVPDSWAEDELYISFKGVESGFAVWLNGSYVGYALDSFTPSDFYLSPYIKDGENKLAVQVFRFTAGSWLEDQDFFRFSGIFRDVYLYTIPKIHIWDLKVETVLSEDFSDADLCLTMSFNEGANGLINARLLYDGGQISSASLSITDITQVSMKLDAPLLWSAEKPNMYKLELRVADDEGNLLEIIK